jgi:outer membrane protease
LVGIALVHLGLSAPVALGFTASSASSSLWHADGQSFRLAMGASVATQRGDMTYTIKGSENGGWMSELEWPFEGMLYAGGIVSVRAWERVHLNVGGWKNLNRESGTMKDSDWFDELRPILLLIYGDETAIYGEFDTNVDAWQLDSNVRVDALRFSWMTVGIMAGYQYSRTRWETADGYQRSPLPAYNVGTVSGPGINYEQKIAVPYLGLAASIIPETSPVDLDLYALYSPFARCDDVDDHVAREKESIGSTDGVFLSVGSDIYFRLNPSWSFTGMVTYTKYDLEGSQDQEFYGGSNAGTRFSDIDMTVTGSQIAFGFLVSYTLR